MCVCAPGSCPFVKGVFTVESAAHLTILFSFIASAFFFGTTNLDGFVDATNHLSSYSSMARSSTPSLTFFALDFRL